MRNIWHDRLAAAIAQIRKEKHVTMCLKCGEETLRAFMTHHPRICNECYTILDIDRHAERTGPVGPRRRFAYCVWNHETQSWDPAETMIGGNDA